MCQCIMCFNKATHISSNSELALCDECYTSFEDEYECSMEDELGCSFDEYYEFEDVDE